MFKKYKLVIEYTVNGIERSTNSSNSDIAFNEKVDGSKFYLTIDAKKPLYITKASMEINYPFDSGATFFANGYQSWTDTKEFSKNEKMPDIGNIGKTIIGKKMGLKYVGDYTFVDYSKNKGVFHSHSYAYIRSSKTIDLIGSLSDRNGYTIIKADMNKNTLCITKDVVGVRMQGEYLLFNLFNQKGAYDEIFDAYFDAMQIKPITHEKIKGYTSWYNYYQNISEEVILRDLDALSKRTDLIDTFQIDDGYQVAVGEWLNIDKKKFPNGMKPMADAIHEKGLQAGIWLNPYGVQRTSSMAKEKKNWLIKDEKGKPICVGGNWGGFYALDIYNDEVRAYLKNVFDVVLNDWGFDLVKLDFLYAAAILPRNNKSRGEIMYDAIDFIRECVGSKKVLGCGVPMMPCFGKFEYMRIGADMTHEWNDTFMRKQMHREDVSTINAVNNSIYRRSLNERAFLCDPDVFLLRDYNIKFTFEQRKMLAKFIKITGSVLFTSDDVNRYDDKQMQCLQDTFSNSHLTLQDIEVENDLCTIEYNEDGKDKILVFDMNTGLER